MGVIMLRCGNQLRLHQYELDKFYKITGMYPVNIENVNGLNVFIDGQLTQFDHRTNESKLLGLMFEDEKIV
jgi:hypothetical protein